MTSQTIFKTYLQTTVKEITKELHTITKGLHTSDASEIKTLQKRFTDSWFGGKMLRGTLVKLGYELVSEKQTKAIFKPACAFEILHTSLLIHDDIIDKSATRRGKSALHIHENSHYGISQAICLGDLGIALAGQLIAESDFPQDRKNRALMNFNQTIQNTILGEMMDVVSAQKLHRVEKEVLQIHKMKTADYSLIGPLTLGAVLGGATDDVLLKIKQFGDPLGVAYQIQDDILGIFGEEEKIGKSTISDIEENKSTLLITFALKHANAQQKKQLTDYYGKKDITSDQKNIIKQLFIETGALEKNNKKIDELMLQAKKSISLLSQNKDKQILLTQFCDFLMKREA